MGSNTLSSITNLIGYLVSLHVDNVCTSANQTSLKDVVLLQHALTRFIGAENGMHDFSDDTPDLIEVLNRNVSGQFSKEAGTIWEPGNPMHLTHLTNALIHAISRTQNGNTDEIIPKFSFGLNARRLLLERS